MAESKAPRHIAVILDGNRRYGKKVGNKLKGHEAGAKKVGELLKWCRELGIKEVTLYCFSMENFKRPKEEVECLMRLFQEQIKKLNNDEKLSKSKAKIRFIGRLHLFPRALRKAMEELMRKTIGNTQFTVNFAIGYSGRAEIVDAVKKIAYKVMDNEIKAEDIDEELVRDNLYLSNEPDIVIRTGNEKRISNFLLWQSAYSELFFLEKLWPEFEKEDLVKVIEEFKRRERRFGR
jgi:tritrans,polycis-undecaprenyl-diphosphate synthase [geranylgeranyl-diphosphate specific]